MAYKNGRVNERNTGYWSLDGQPKQKGKKASRLSEEEIQLAKDVLQAVYDCLQFDEVLSTRGHLHDESVWTDGGRFLIALTGKQKDTLFDIINERKL